MLPLIPALLLGLQHALAMIAGIATSGGLLIAGDACARWQLDSEMASRVRRGRRKALHGHSPRSTRG